MQETQIRTGAGLDRRRMLGLGLAAGVGMTLAACGNDEGTTTSAARATPAGVEPSEPTVTNGDQAVDRLKAGNQRFMAGSVTHPDQAVKYRAGLVAGQHPFATILSCVDSRVPAEILFDQGLGDLFVARTAGQVVDHAVLGSIQFGVAELKIPMLVVMGHQKCGAVKATVEAVEKKSKASGTDIDALVAGIKPAATQALADKEADPVDAAVRHNVINIVASLSAKPVIKEALAAGSLKIAGTRYDLESGAIEWL